MAFQDLPIRRKVSAVIMVTTVAALLVATTALMVYDLVTARKEMVRSLSITSSIVASNNTASLIYQDPEDAQENLNSVMADAHIVGAALYDQNGDLFVHFPTNEPASSFPAKPGPRGHRWEGRHLIYFQPIAKEGFIGTAYLKSNLTGLEERLRLYVLIALLVLGGSASLALVLSARLQRRISSPILALADTAKIISAQRDYSVRAPKTSSDELGLLTDAFNHMLTRIQEQTVELREQTQMLELANVMVRDLHDRIILWNTGMEKIYGWSKGEAMGKVSHELLRTEFPQAPESIRTELFARGHWEGELIHFRKDGGRLVVASQWVVHNDANGRPAAILEINNDITERKRAEDQILQLNAELEQRVQNRTAELIAANKELEAFTYSVAHDLRAPLRHIDAFSRILFEDFGTSLSPEAQRYLSNIQNGSKKMSRLVDDLLNLAHVGRQELLRQPISLSHLVGEVLIDLKRETDGRAIEWRIQPLPVLQCDGGLMKQVFANLLSNAVKYTRTRNPAVVEIGSIEQNGNTAVFVRDNGVGFSMKYADKLFGVFQRLHRAEEFEGTGVGLATVERIVRRHGGSVWAEADVGKGATFFFSFPKEHPK